MSWIWAVTILRHYEEKRAVWKQGRWEAGRRCRHGDVGWKGVPFYPCLIMRWCVGGGKDFIRILAHSNCVFFFFFSKVGAFSALSPLIPAESRQHQIKYINTNKGCSLGLARFADAVIQSPRRQKHQKVDGKMKSDLKVAKNECSVVSAEHLGGFSPATKPPHQ